MSQRPPLEVADICRQYAGPYLALHGASPQQRRVMRDIQVCRTAALGGHVQQCDRCGHQAISYNSCRNRHCPKCQGPARARWLDARTRELLPVPYFHVVFTLPAMLAPLAMQNPVVMYALLFQSIAATLLEVAANPRRLGARIGFLTVLHTWGQNLMHHPHVHCVVPAGGLSPDGTRWLFGRADFFLPVRVLSLVFRGKFIGLIKSAFRQGKLEAAWRPLTIPFSRAVPGCLRGAMRVAARNQRLTATVRLRDTSSKPAGPPLFEHKVKPHEHLEFR